MEIGSDYSLNLSDLSKKEKCISNYLSSFSHLYYFDSGRSAIKHISKHLKPNDEILMPEYICESVLCCFNKANIKFYRINEDFSINISDLKSKITKRTAILYVLHYFGALQPQCVLDEIKSVSIKNNLVIIEDTTHSLFSAKKTIGDYLVCSIRKWVPIPNGGVLYYSENKMNIEKPLYNRNNDNSRLYAMTLKELYLNGVINNKSVYRKIFAECENNLDSQKTIMLASELSEFLLDCFDINELIYARIQNYSFLKDLLKKQGFNTALEIDSYCTPLCFVIRSKKRDTIKTYLSDNNIYCATHWPFDGDSPVQRPNAIKNSQELLSIPVDQRYNCEHMKYVAEVLLKSGGVTNS